MPQHAHDRKSYVQTAAAIAILVAMAEASLQGLQCPHA